MNVLKGLVAIVLAVGMCVGAGPYALADGASDAAIQQQLKLIDELSAKGPKDRLADAWHDLGSKYFDRGDVDKAQDALSKSLAIEKTLNRPKLLLATHLELAKILLRMQRYDDARNEYESVISLAQKTYPAGEIAGLYNNIGFAMMSGQRYGEAQTYFNKALDVATKNNAQDVRGSTLINLAQLYRSHDDYPHAIESARQACDTLSKIESDDYGSALSALGHLLQDTSKTADALEAYKKMQQFYSNPPDPTWLATADDCIGDCYYSLGDMNEAKKHYQAALDLSGGDKNTDSVLTSTISLGVIEADSLHFDKAEALHKKAYDLARSQNKVPFQVQALIQLQNDVLLEGNPEKALHQLQQAEKDFANATLNPMYRGELAVATGHCYRELGQFDAAEGYYQEALRQFGAAHDLSRMALVYGALAVLYLDSKNLGKFADTYTQAKTLYENVDDKKEQGKLEFNFGQSQIVQGKYADAIKTYESALAHVRAAKDPVTESGILRGLGLAQLLTNQPDKALVSYQQAQQLLANGTVESRWDCSLGLGKAYKMLKNYPAAEKCLREAADLVETERSHLSRDSFKTYNLDLRRDCFDELVDLLAETNHPYEALEIAERGKARAFLDMLANRANLRLDLSSIDNQATTMVAGTEKGTRAVSVLPRSEASVEETAISPINAQPPSIQEMREIVQRRGSTCLEFFRAQNKLYIWVLHPDGKIDMPPPVVLPYQDLYNLVSDTYRQVISIPKDPTALRVQGMKRQEDLRRLYKILIGPVESYLPKNKDEIITLIPHGILFNVPFAALMGSSDNFFIEQHTISFAPALGVLRATQKLNVDVASIPHHLLALGNPITQQNAFLGSLPYAEKEVKNIAQLFGSDKATVKTGSDATREAFTQALRGAAEIHLATHGLVDEERPMKSALVLAPHDSDDGLLKVKDIMTLRDLKPKLIVLSACQTGRGKITGDGVVGLSRAFIIAGTPSILVSQWNVDDVITEFQMTRFYKFYLAGKDKAHSLRDAQVATISFLENGATNHSDPTFIRANPRFWAAFELIGENN
jgi:CHAT domain-containing protein/tetratricopeptide (TPR) repeat protein